MISKWKQWRGVMIIICSLLSVLCSIVLLNHAKYIQAERQMITIPLKDTLAGTEVTFANQQWIVLDPETGYMIMKSPLTTEYFSPHSNIFEIDHPYGIGKYLNNYYFQNFFEWYEQDAIRFHDWNIYFSGVVNARIGLLSYDEWVHYYGEDILKPPSAPMWTITPYFLETNHVLIIESDGTHSHRHCSDSHVAVHPTLYVDPEYEVFQTVELDVSFSPNGSESWKTSHATELSAVNPNNTIKQFDYIWSTDNGTPASDDEGWESFSDGETIISPAGKTGEYYVHVRGMDESGSIIFNRTSEAFKQDNTPPSIPIIHGLLSTWTNANEVLFTITPGLDDDSLIKETKVRITPNEWFNYTAGQTLAITEEGKHIIEAKSIDNALNESELTTGIIKIDRTNPTLSIQRKTHPSQL